MEHREELSEELSEEPTQEPSYTPSPDSIADPLRSGTVSARISTSEVPNFPAPAPPTEDNSEEGLVVPNCLVKIRITPEDSGVPEMNQYRGIWTAYFVRKDWCTGANLRNRRKLTRIFLSFYLLELPAQYCPYSNPSTEFQQTWNGLIQTHYLLVPIRVLRQMQESGELHPGCIDLIGMKLNQNGTWSLGHNLNNIHLKVVDRCFNGVWVSPTTSRSEASNTMRGHYGTDREMLSAYQRGAEAVDAYVFESISKLGGLF